MLLCTHQRSEPVAIRAQFNGKYCQFWGKLSHVRPAFVEELLEPQEEIRHHLVENVKFYVQS